MFNLCIFLVTNDTERFLKETIVSCLCFLSVLLRFLVKDCRPLAQYALHYSECSVLLPHFPPAHPMLKDLESMYLILKPLLDFYPIFP